MGLSVRRRKAPRGSLVAAIGMLSFAACSNDCCNERTETYRISGDPPSSATQCPAMILEFLEESSSRCAGQCNRSMSQPGDFILDKPVSISAVWSVDVPVVYVESRPSVDVFAMCDTNQNGSIDSDEECIGFKLSLAAGNHQGVTLSAPPCPHRL